MAASDAQIANVALIFVERKAITALNDGSTSANDCTAIFEPTREALLRGHDWNFARKRAELVQTSDTPVGEFDYEYTLPSDWLATRVVSDNDNFIPGIPYKQEINTDEDGGVILASSEDLYLIYTMNLTDPTLMPADFRACFSYELAIQLARTNTDRERAEKQRDRYEKRAKSADAIEDDSEDMQPGSWVLARWR